MTRLAWWIFLGALTLAAVLAPLGRDAPDRAARALAAGDGQAALAQAQALVGSRPVPAEHLLMLATAKLRTNDRKGFEDAFRLATERGWRVEAVQIVAAQSAIAQGDADAAANRVAALWALGGTARELPALTRALLAMPHGPEAFGKALGGTRVWQNGFLRRGAEMASPDRIARMLSAARSNGAAFDCAVLESHLPDQAQALEQCQ